MISENQPIGQIKLADPVEMLMLFGGGRHVMSFSPQP
jgi:hypothetical protein